MHISGFPSSFFRACIRCSVSALFMHRAALPPSYTMCGLLSSSCVAFTLHPFMRCVLLLLSCISQAPFIHALHPASPFNQLGFAHSCATSYLSFHVSARLHSFMHCTLPLLGCISHEVWSLPDLGMYQDRHKLYVQEIRADRYKTPCWPIRSFFSLVHIA